MRCEVRNKWGHCNFDEWTDGNFQNCFQVMETMVSSLGLKPEDETKLISDLCDWKEKGELCQKCCSSERSWSVLALLQRCILNELVKPFTPVWLEDTFVKLISVQI